MLSLLLSGFGFLIWVITIISVYYSTFYSRIDHIERAVGYLPYILTVGFLYITYKVLTLMVFPQKKLKFGFFTIAGVTLLHILIVSGFYSGFPEVIASLKGITATTPSGLTLFAHIISLLLYPIFLVFVTRSIGFSVGFLTIPSWRDIDMRIRVPVEITLGFLVFMTGLLILGATGTYTLTGLSILLTILTVSGFLGHRETYTDITTRSIILENHAPEGNFWDVVQLKLLSIEFGYFFLTFLFAVALINVIRPMPIGWDDLGVYMNFPKIMATSGEYLRGAGMYSWQLITGTGFLFGHTAAQAFYVNQLGGILAVITIISTLSYAFAENGKKSLLSLPVLFAAVYYAMPMTVFQQAKDMKLDPAYLAFAVSGFMLLFSLWDPRKLDRKNLSILALSGVIIAFTFTVKFTSLMLILGAFGLISYRLLSIGGYIGFFFAFLAIFTQADLWQKLFIWMPRDNHTLITQISIGLLICSLLGFAYAWYEKKEIKPFQTWLISICIFGLGLIVGLSPWVIKNISESPKIGVDSMLTGFAGPTAFDYKKLYPQSEYDARTKAATDSAITSDGQSQNEDFSRYFGQEKGINNYLKLPVNLTFQKNQTGEFTDITYIFLALVPAAFFFLRSRFRIVEGAVVIGMIFVLIYCFFPSLTSPFFANIGIGLTPFFAKINLPLGYAVLIAVNLLLVGLVHFLTPRDGMASQKFRDTMVFMGLYGFLFWLSAFGIVWYGIVIYFGFFLLIMFACSWFLLYSSEGERDEEYMGMRFALALVVFFAIGFYFLNSAFSHGWNNLRGSFSDKYIGVVGQYILKPTDIGVYSDEKEMLVGGKPQKVQVYIQRSYASAGFNEYKYNILTQDESIFANRSDYLLPIATMNLKDTSQIFNNFSKPLSSPDMKKLVGSGEISKIPLDQLHSFISQTRFSPKTPMSADLVTLGRYMYDQVLYPTKETENLGGIYRIGTFMTYLINKNNSRYYDDSLVFNFQNYFYDPSPEVTIDRMSKFGLKYLLVDLNAATIDQDARHALVNRFENLLVTMTAKNLKLVTTDNFCLEFALGERQKGNLLDRDTFIDIAGTNYESYRKGQQITRTQKTSACQDYIVKRINEGADVQYPVLAAMKKAMVDQSVGTDLTKQKAIVSKYVGQSWFALFEITDLPSGYTLPPALAFGALPPVISTSLSGNTLSGGVLSGSSLLGSSVSGVLLSGAHR